MNKIIYSSFIDEIKISKKVLNNNVYRSTYENIRFL